MATPQITTISPWIHLKDWIAEKPARRMASIDVSVNCVSCRLIDLDSPGRRGFVSIGVDVEPEGAIARALGGGR